MRESKELSPPAEIIAAKWLTALTSKSHAVF
jgi:hypothetical protein